GRKQIFRRFAGGVAAGDTLALADETLEGEPLLRPVMRGGVRTEAGHESLEAPRARAAAELARLPERLRRLEHAAERYDVRVSDALQAEADEVGGVAGRAEGGAR